MCKTFKETALARLSVRVSGKKQSAARQKLGTNSAKSESDKSGKRGLVEKKKKKKVDKSFESFPTFFLCELLDTCNVRRVSAHVLSGSQDSSH